MVGGPLTGNQCWDAMNGGAILDETMADGMVALV